MAFNPHRLSSIVLNSWQRIQIQIFWTGLRASAAIWRTVTHFEILCISITLWHILLDLLEAELKCTCVQYLNLHSFLLTETLPEIFWYERRQWSGVSWKEYAASSSSRRLRPPRPPPPVSAWRRSSAYFSIVTPKSSASLISSSSDTGHRRHIYFPLKIEEQPDKGDREPGKDVLSCCTAARLHLRVPISTSNTKAPTSQNSAHSCHNPSHGCQLCRWTAIENWRALILQVSFKRARRRRHIEPRTHKHM